MTELKWQDPPAKRRGPATLAFTADVRDALRANPGAWALVNTTTHGVNARRWQKAYGPDGFEFASRTVVGSDPKRFDTYARFNPAAALSTISNDAKLADRLAAIGVQA